MQSNYFLNKKDDFSKNDNIKSIIYISENENQTITKKYLHQIVFGVEDYSEMKFLINTFNKDSNIVLSKISEEILINVKYTNYIVLYEDANMHQLIFLDNKDLKEYIKLYKKYLIIIDKDDILADEINSQYDSNWVIPNKDIFIEECIEFFIELVQVALNYEEKNVSKAIILKNSILDRLVYMINSYLSIKYKNGIKVNQYGHNFSVYLEKDYYEEYLYILLSDGKEELWTSIFKSAQLFRSIALHIADTEDYTYPKKEDVHTMKILRDLYNRAI